MPDQPSLFEPEPVPETGDRLRPRAGFLAGMLSQWVLGDARPTPAEKQAFQQVAEEALDRASSLAR